VSERGQMLEAWMRDGAYEVTWTYRRPSGDTVVMLRSRPPRQPGVCPSVWLSLRDPQDLALLRRLRAGEGEPAPIVAPSPEDIAPLGRHLSPRTLVRGLFGGRVQEGPPPEAH
jgi:hypothetical protein